MSERRGVIEIARDWHRANPRSRVVYHRNWRMLSPEARSRLSSPRISRVCGDVVYFDGYSSSLSLDQTFGTARVDDERRLEVLAPDGLVLVIYEAETGEKRKK